MTTALGLVLAGLAVLGLYGAWANKNPWHLLQVALGSKMTVAPLDHG